MFLLVLIGVYVGHVQFHLKAVVVFLKVVAVYGLTAVHMVGFHMISGRSDHMEMPWSATEAIIAAAIAAIAEAEKFLSR